MTERHDDAPHGARNDDVQVPGTRATDEKPSENGRGRRRGVARVLVAGLVVLATAGVGANVWVKSVAAPAVYDTVEEVPGRYVAIVLGARVYADGRPSPALEDRLHAALQLYEAGRVRRILVTGDHGRRGYDEVNAMHAWLLARGVPVEDVFLDHAGFRTFDSMERAARVFRVEDAVVCTQRYHLYRALFLARRAGIDAVGLAADRRAYAHARANDRREFVARIVAVLDSYGPWRRPRHLGAPIPIDGDATATHDRWTQLGR